MRSSKWLVMLIAATSGCDIVFRLDPVHVPDAAAPDAQVSCSSSPIVLAPTGQDGSTWETQSPGSIPHFELVGESVADNDATYIASKIDALVELYTHAPLAIAATASIDSVTVWAVARVEATAANFEVGVGLSSGTLSYDDQPVTTTYAPYSSIRSTDPFSGMAWTIGAVNAMTFGVRKSYADVTARVTRVWAEVRCHD